MKKLTQSKLESFIESFLNIISGFIIALLVWMYIVPILFNVKSNLSQGFGITLLFTFMSIIRSYIWRRYFNNVTRKRIHKFLGG